MEYRQQNITIIWNVTGCKHVDWIAGFQWRDLVNTVMTKWNAHRINYTSLTVKGALLHLAGS
jgi:hypothetical protein